MSLQKWLLVLLYPVTLVYFRLIKSSWYIIKGLSNPVIEWPRIAEIPTGLASVIIIECKSRLH